MKDRGTAQPACRRCEDMRWVCEKHLDRPYLHEGCFHPKGSQCSACNAGKDPESGSSWLAFVSTKRHLNRGRMTTLRRYLSFSRFAWMLQTKQLWLTRSDNLGDRWECNLTHEQLKFLISRHPLQPVDDHRPREGAIERTTRIVKDRQRRTFVSCWSATGSESHALWQIYCPPSEGVAIESTFDRVATSVPRFATSSVSYEQPRADVTPSVDEMVFTKQSWFGYEEEVRVVDYIEDGEELPALGYSINWDPEIVLSSVIAHPDANASFLEALHNLVSAHAPALNKCVRPSTMTSTPPIY
jgi:hypothetical protein